MEIAARSIRRFLLTIVLCAFAFAGAWQVSAATIDGIDYDTSWQHRMYVSAYIENNNDPEMGGIGELYPIGQGSYCDVRIWYREAGVTTDIFNGESDYLELKAFQNTPFDNGKVLLSTTHMYIPRDSSKWKPYVESDQVTIYESDQSCYDVFQTKTVIDEKTLSHTSDVDYTVVIPSQKYSDSQVKTFTTSSLRIAMIAWNDLLTYTYGKGIEYLGFPGYCDSHSFDCSVTKEANCTETGVKEYICKNCAGTVHEVIPTNDNHVWNPFGTRIQDPTIDQQGKIEYTCTLCGTTKVETIPPLTSNDMNSMAVYLNGKGPYYGGAARFEEFTYKATYTSHEIRPSIYVENRDYMGLKNETDYTYNFSDNVNAGTGRVTITGKGNYTGTQEIPFKIERAKIDYVSTKYDTYSYTGKEIKPPVQVLFYSFSFDESLTKDVDYTVTYSNNVKIGSKAKITVEGIGNFQGKKVAYFTIVKKTNPMTLKAKTATVKYSKVKKKAQTIKRTALVAVSNAKGTVTYKKTSGNKKITVSKAGTFTVKKGLKKGTYKVKVLVTAAGTSIYKSKSRYVTVTIKVK